MSEGADFVVRIAEDADTAVRVVGDQVLNLAGAAAGEVVVVGPGETLDTRTLVDGDIPATIARDAEVTAAVAAEASARSTADGLLIPKATADAQSVLGAITDDTPIAIAVAASQFVGRKSSGNVTALTVAEAKTELGVAAASGIASLDANTLVPYAQNPAAIRRKLMMPTGAFAETITGGRSVRMDGASLLSSGRLHLVGIPLVAGDTVTSITFVSGATPGSNLTHCVFALYNSSRVLLGQTGDNTAATWAAETARTQNLAVAYPVVTSAMYYIGLWVVHSGGAVPNFYCVSQTSSGVTGIAPITTGTSTTGLTDTAPDPALALTASTVIPYGYVS